MNQKAQRNLQDFKIINLVNLIVILIQKADLKSINLSNLNQ